MRLKEAAETLGVSASTLKRFLRLYLPGYLKKTPGGYYRLTPEDVQKIDFFMTQKGLEASPEGRFKARRYVTRWGPRL